MTLNSLKMKTVENENTIDPRKTKSFMLEDGTKFVIPLRTRRIKHYGSFHNDHGCKTELKTRQLKAIIDDDHGIKLHIRKVKEASLTSSKEIFIQKTAKLKYTHCPSQLSDSGQEQDCCNDQEANSLPSFYQRNKRDTSDSKLSDGMCNMNKSRTLEGMPLSRAKPKQHGRLSRSRSLLCESAYQNLHHYSGNRLPNIYEDNVS